MKDIFKNPPSLKAVGFIHFSCFCGMDIYCIEGSSEEESTERVFSELRTLLNGRPAALFSAADGLIAQCPDCGIELELPSPAVLSAMARRAQEVAFESRPAVSTISQAPGDLASL